MLMRRMKNFIALLVLLEPAQALSYILHGGAGSTSNELEDVDINPANAAFINQSKVGLKLNLNSQQTLKYRYPDSEPQVRSKNQSIDKALGPDALPFHYLAAPLPRLSLGVLAAPPLAIDIEQKLERLPVVVLDSLDFVDIRVHDIKVENFFTGYLAFRAGDFGLGLALRSLKASAKADISSSGSGGYLATAKVRLSQLASQVGLRWAVLPKNLELSLVSNVLEEQSVGVSLTENLPGGISPADSKPSEFKIQNPANHFTVGLHAALRQHHLYLDGERQVADTNQTTVSLHDFTVKKRDVVDTFAVRGGYAFYLSRTWHLHLGAAYEPSAIGPGSQGPNGKAGFGALDVIPVVGLDQFITPYKEYVAGLSFHSPSSANSAERRRRTAFVISAGYAVRTASLGIDAHGEQPAAYSMRRTWLPLSLAYTL